MSGATCGKLRRVLMRLVFVLSILACSGCATARFLWQAGWGHLEIMSRAEPIAVLLRHNRAPEKLRALLLEVEPIKKFGGRHGLDKSSNYQSYAELDREAVVWSVSACAPLAFEAHTWSFPLVGEIPYLGWFDKKAASVYADELRAEGLDVHLRAVSAYSTLGWLSDPLLSTMLDRGPERYGTLANIILHESVHASVYVTDQAVFNESLASFVADRLTPVYLTQRYGKDTDQSRAYLAVMAEWQEELEKLAAAYRALKALYASKLSDAEKLARKKTLLGELMVALDAEQEINNATLIDFATYRTGEKELEALLTACDHNWPRFLGAVKNLEAADFKEPEQEDFAVALAPLIAAGCPAK